MITILCGSGPRVVRRKSRPDPAPRRRGIAERSHPTPNAQHPTPKSEVGRTPTRRQPGCRVRRRESYGVSLARTRHLAVAQSQGEVTQHPTPGGRFCPRSLPGGDPAAAAAERNRRRPDPRRSPQGHLAPKQRPRRRRLPPRPRLSPGGWPCRTARARKLRRPASICRPP